MANKYVEWGTAAAAAISAAIMTDGYLEKEEEKEQKEKEVIEIFKYFMLDNVY